MTIFTSGSYNLNSFIPQDWRGWSDYITRLQRYDVFAGYYHNIAYHSLVSYSQALKVQEHLYKHVRGVYNPINRLVEGYVAKVWGGNLDMRTGEAGAIPLDAENETLRMAIIQLWRDSQWGQKKSLVTRYGANLGDAFIKVVDDLRYQQVRLEAVDPAKVKHVEKAGNGEIELIQFEYYIRNPSTNRLSLYCETITPETFKIETDGETMPAVMNGRGEMVSEWNNEYGFVPVVHIMHTDVGLGFGAPAAHGTLHKINELNDLASILNDGMRNQVHMPMITFGAKINQLDLGSDGSRNTNNPSDNPKKDTVSALNFPVDARAEFPAPALNIADGLQNIIQIEMELERDLPELALHRLREGGNLTAPGVRSAYDDAIARYQEARGTYDAALVQAQQMAVAIGGMRGYRGYQGFNLLSLENGAIEHQIQERPVIGDSLALTEKLDKTFAAMQQNAPKTVYVEMGWSESQADEIIESAQTQQDAFMMTNPFQQQNQLQPAQDENATPQDAFDTEQNAGVNETDLLGASELLQES